MKRAFIQTQPIPTDLHGYSDPNDDASTRLCLRLKLPKLAEVPEPEKRVEDFEPARLSILSSTAKRNILFSLQSLETRLPLGTEETKAALAQVQLLLVTQSSTSILCKSISTFCQLCLHPLVDPVPPLSELLGSSHMLQVIASNAHFVPTFFRSLTALATTKSISSAPLILLAQASLSAPSTPSIRMAALELIASLDSSLNGAASRSTLLAFSHDGDGRVRSVALRLLRDAQLKSSNGRVTLNATSGNNAMDVTASGSSDEEAVFDQKLFEHAIASLTDDSEEAQLESVRILWTLANRRRDLEISATTTMDRTKEALVEEVFRKLCNMVSDVSIRVRAEACGLLGTLTGVSTKLLLQSLSKNMLKVGVEAFGGSKASSASNTSGSSSSPSPMLIKEDPFDPKTEGATTITASKFSDAKNKLIDSSANGAFVHGLEDEFKEVRDAALSSICELSHKSRKFAISATEFFVDMFNDEIDSVRVNAIQSLSAIGKVIFLTEAQLLVVLAMLDDANLDVRNASRKLLQNIRLINASSLLTTTAALIASLLKHFIEKDMILPTYSALGRNHPHFVELLLEDLIKLDTRFLMREPRLDDINYLCTAVLVLNAAKENANLIELLPPFFNRHYLFLKRHYPLLVPDVPSLEATISQRLLQQKSAISDHVLVGVASVSHESRKNVLGASSSSSSSAGFNTDFGFLGYAPVALHCLGSNTALKSKGETFSFETLLRRLHTLLVDLTPLDSDTPLSAAKEANILLGTLQLDAIALRKGANNTTNFYFELLDLIQLCLEFAQAPSSPTQQKIVNAAYTLEQTYLGLTPSMKTFLIRLRQNHSQALADSSAEKSWLIPGWTSELFRHDLKRVSAQILAPTAGDVSSSLPQGGSSGTSVKEFYMRLPLSVHFEAEIKNSSDFGDLYVEFSSLAPPFHEIHAVRSSMVAKTGSLGLTVCADISATHKRWEANKSVLMAVKLIKRHGFAVCELAPSVSIALLPNLR